jgi:beta-N-acetylhexosaminidase
MKNFNLSAPVAKLSFIILMSLIVTFESVSQSSDLLSRQDSIAIKVGQMIMVGIGDFNSPNIENKIYDAAKAGIIGGVIVYEKNINAADPINSLTKIISRLQQSSTIPLFVSIDEEGGHVSRLKNKYGFPQTKKAEQLGKMNNTDSTYYYAELTANTLSKLGINLNYAPDIDVNINPASPAIGKLGRSYSSDPAIVASNAAAVVKAHRAYNVGTVLKHFPGHGSSSTDTHKDLTDVTNTWRFTELLPYKTLLDSGLVDAVMTAHIINEHLDSSKTPATLSKTIMTDILRGFLGFNGVVFSDDMQMHAISKQYGTAQAIKMTINAGVDVIMFAHNVPQADKKPAEDIHSMVVQMVLNGDISEERINESYNRIMTFKRKLGLFNAKLLLESEVPQKELKKKKN